MSSRIKPAPRRAHPPLRVRKFDYEKQLQRYPRSCRTAVRHVASRHPSLRDLAFSFPALLFVCAVQHKNVDRKGLSARVVAGESLKDLAGAAGLPMWTRKLPPQAFTVAIGPLPDSPFVARRIVNLLPKNNRDWARWLSFVTHAMQWGDEGFALWIAQVFKDIPKRIKECDLRRFALWVWFSARPQSAAGRLVLRRWSLAMSWKAAWDAVDCWFESLTLFLVLGRSSIHYAKLTDGTVNGLTFVTLRSAKEVFQEVQIFDNCMRGYAYCLKQRDGRLISVRRDGVSIALLWATEGKGQRRFAIEELRTPRNGMVSDKVAEAVRAWFLAQDPLVLESDVGPFDDRLCQHQWQEFWKPYWMEKGRNPALPFRADEDSFRKLRW